MIRIRADTKKAAKKEIEDENKILEEEVKRLTLSLADKREKLTNNKSKLEQLANLWRIHSDFEM